MKRWLCTLLVMACLTACTSSWQREKTADATGCPARDIRITPDPNNFETLQAWYAACQGNSTRCVQTWDADCRGQRYHCVFQANVRGVCFLEAAGTH